VGLIFIAVFIALLAGPILLEFLWDLFSKTVEKTAKGGFLLGLGILLVGLLARTRILEIAGAVVVGAVLLAVIADNYLINRTTYAIPRGLTLTAAGPRARSGPRSSPRSWRPPPGPRRERWRGSG
jgi:hypothetical protein